MIAIGGSGSQSSEFKMMILMAIVVVANGTPWVHIEPELLMTFITATMAFVAERGWVKHKTANVEEAKAKNGSGV